MKKMVKVSKSYSFILSIIAIIALLSFPVMAGNNAEDFVQKKVDYALAFIADKDLELEDKKEKFMSVLEESFDLKTIGRFSLGPHWRQLDKSKRDDFFDLFRTYIVNVYSQRFTDYSGEKFTVNGSRAEGNKDFIVFSSFKPSKGNPVRIDWRVRHKNGQYKIVDVLVEGVSMAITQRSDFSAVIRRNGNSVDALLEHLEKQNAV